MGLTEAGMQLHSAIGPAFRLIDDALELLQDANFRQSSLKIAAVHTLTYYFLGDLISAITPERGDANVHLMARSSPEVVDLVASGKAELGFVYDSAVTRSGLVSVNLFDDEMCLIVRAEDSAYGLDIDLSEQPQRFVVFPQHYALRKMLHHSQFNFVAAAETETVDAMLKLVSTGIGSCLLPLRMPDHMLADYRLRKVRVRGMPIVRRVVAIHQDGRPLSPLGALTLEVARRLSARMIE